MKRLVPGLVLALLLAAPALAQIPTDAIATLRTEAIYVQAGAEKVDTGSLESSIARAADLGFDLRIAVLTDPGNAQSAAETVRDALDRVTAIVYTADQWAVASDQLTDGALRSALEASGETLSSGSIEEGVAAFVDALEPSSRTPFIIGAGIIVAFFASVAVFGQWWDGKERAKRQAARVERRRSKLMDQVSAGADDVLALSDRVEVADNEAIATRYRDAAAEFTDVEKTVKGAADMHALDEAENRIVELTNRLAAIRKALEA